jgi:hypothetical protein
VINSELIRPTPYGPLWASTSVDEYTRSRGGRTNSGLAAKRELACSSIVSKVPYLIDLCRRSLIIKPSEKRIGFPGFAKPPNWQALLACLKYLDVFVVDP